jgi:pimeloyl-ACP methyl ester carboxylesterase
MHFVDEGEGVPMVFVHGNPGWSLSTRRVKPAFGEWLDDRSCPCASILLGSAITFFDAEME